MAKREDLQQRLTYYRNLLEKLHDAYLALVEGQVKSYEIDDRSLTRLDLPSLKKAINDAEEKVDLLEDLLDGKKPRKIVAVVPRDW
jgi:hypothetical protein